jgi:hypothetical protein
MLRGFALRIDYGIILVSVVFFVASIYMGGLSFQVADLPLRVGLVNFATSLFFVGVMLQVFLVLVFVLKRRLAKVT